MSYEEIGEIKRRLNNLEARLAPIHEWFHDREQKTDDDVEAVEWRPFKSGATGEWTFATQRNGEIYPEIVNLVLRLKTKPNKTEKIGGFNYRLSGDDDKFLQRFPVDR